MKVSNWIKYLYILSFTFVQSANAYQLSKTTDQLKIKWPTGTTQVEIYFNPSNPYGVSEATLQNIATDSAAEWNNTTNISIAKGSSAGKNQEGVNEIYFTDDPNVFNSSNSAVAAITQVSYKDSDGIILEGDVLINQNNLINTTKTSSLYIGNILTHELGHFLGLNHSQVIGSTMFWALSLGQNELSDDDKAGLYSIYPNGNSQLSSLSGKIVGGKGLVAVFGVEVEAISQATGKIMGATISETDGSFTIDGLPINDKYFIYTKPSIASKLSTHFSAVKNNFCDNGTSYRGSFFSACGGSNEGYPQAVSLGSSTVNVGNVSIRCSLDVPTDYLQKKTNGLSTYNPITSTVNGIGNAFVGFFSSQSINNGTASDHFKIDLTSVSTTTWNNLSATNNLYLNVQVLNQSFYSPFQADVTITVGAATYTVPKYIQGTDGWYNINSNFYIPIDKATIANNLFDVGIIANKMDAVTTPTGLPTSIAYILPDYSEFVDSVYFYLLNAQIVKKNADNTYSVASSRNYAVSDNSSCPDANNTYALTSYTTTGKAATNEKRSSPMSCGTIDTGDDDNHSGPFGMIVGFFLVYLIMHLKKRLRFI